MAFEQTVVIDVSDILVHAAKLGYDWNTTCELFQKDRIYPQDGRYELWASEAENNDYGWSEDTQKIIADFFKSNKLEKCTVSQ